jgi:hypothetical protein
LNSYDDPSCNRLSFFFGIEKHCKLLELLPQMIDDVVVPKRGPCLEVVGGLWGGGGELRVEDTVELKNECLASMLDSFEENWVKGDYIPTRP